MAISQAAATGSVTLDQTTYTDLGSMSLTPGAGDYLAVFTMEVVLAGAVGDQVWVALYVNDVLVTDSERYLDSEASIAGQPTMLATAAKVTPGAGQTVKVKYKVVGVNAFTARDRTLVTFPKAGADITELSSGTSDTTTSGTYGAMAGMSTTPAAGTYLAVFTAPVEMGSDNDQVAVSLFVAETQVAHSERTHLRDASLQTYAATVLIAAKVVPNGSETVSVRWRRDAGTGTQTVFQRKLTLVKVATADIAEASGTANDDDTSTSDVAIDNLTVTAPGAADWLAVFSLSDFYGAVAANPDGSTFYSLYVGGSQHANTERELQHEESIDSADVWQGLAAKLTVGASQDVVAEWRGSLGTLTRTAKERTLVMVKEVAGGGGEQPPRLIHRWRKAA